MGTNEKIDVCGMCCPMPLIRIRTAIGKLPKGQLFTIVGDDPIFEDSVRDFCLEHSIEIKTVEKDGRKITITVTL